MVLLAPFKNIYNLKFNEYASSIRIDMCCNNIEININPLSSIAKSMYRNICWRQVLGIQ